jgi:hypothetical protein
MSALRKIRLIRVPNFNIDIRPKFAPPPLLVREIVLALRIWSEPHNQANRNSRENMARSALEICALMATCQSRYLQWKVGWRIRHRNEVKHEYGGAHRNHSK